MRLGLLAGALATTTLAAGCTNAGSVGLLSNPAPATPAIAKPAIAKPASIDLIAKTDAKLSATVSGDAGAAGRAVTMHDPIRIASISKLVTAFGVMRLVDDGTLDLDRDVSEYLGWPLRNPDFPDDVINLRMLLSHTSGLRDDAGYILPIDGRLRELIKQPAVWDKRYRPGAYFAYANLGSPLVAAIMERATGERFDRLMQRTVMTPLGIDACYNWSGCSNGRRVKAVTLLRPSGDLARDPPIATGAFECAVTPATSDKKKGSCNLDLYPLGENGSAFAPQGGLRISAADLMVVASVLKNQGAPLFSKARFVEMTKAYWTHIGVNGDSADGAFHSYGLGIDLQPGGWAGHVGDAYGLRAGLWVNTSTSEMRVRYRTMVDEAIPVGTCLDVCP